MTNVTYKDIADSLFTDYIKIEDTSSVVIDAITNEKLTGTEFNDNSYKYITRIRENLPDIMSLYIKDNKLYYAVKLKDINKLCYQRNIDVSGKYIDIEIDKLLGGNYGKYFICNRNWNRGNGWTCIFRIRTRSRPTRRKSS